MCSIGEDDFGDEGGLHTMAPDPQVDQKDPSHPEVCKSCNIDATVVKLPFKEPQCSACFLAYVRHKFRANIGSNKMIPKNGRLLVVFDGGANSSVLLDMLRYATTMDRFKKLHVVPSVLYVDDSFLRMADQSERVDHLNAIRDLLRQYDLNTHFVSLSTPIIHEFNPIPIEEVDLNKPYSENESHFIETINAFKSLTSKQEFIHCVTSNLMRSCAEKLNCNFIFNSETCPDLAIKLLANISLGRGSSVGQDIAFCDTRSPVRILRPIRDFSGVEISNYLKLSGVRWLDTVAAYGSVNDEFGSIQNLTKGFVDGLQENFQSTISTVFRTGSKIAAVTSKKAVAGVEATSICMSCGSALDGQSAATLLAIEFSKFALIQAKNADVNGSTNMTTDKERLCHGCANMFGEIESNDIVLENKVF